MIKIENVDTYGWDAAIRGMRNPLNSWDKSDSYWGLAEDPSPINPNDEVWFFLGENDLGLAKRLVNAGNDHSKFLRMIGVSFDVTAPLYWWKEFDTYKVGTVANSTSTMHKIHAKEFTRDDFSHEHLLDEDDLEWGDYVPTRILEMTIFMLNHFRDKFNETGDKKYWWQMIQLLPTSYNQRRTVTLNYAVLKNMYHARKAHKLDEWRGFCEWVETLPYAKELIIGE